MSHIRVYTTGCPNCKNLETILDEEGIEYEKIEDMSEITKAIERSGISSMPLIEMGSYMTYAEMLEWIDEGEEE